MKARFNHLLLLAASFVACGSLPLQASDLAADFDAANKLYEERKYSDAVAAYEKLERTHLASPALYFNLGNAFFKSGQIGRAIVAYRQAESLAPRDPDVSANLQFARNQIPGPATAPSRWQRWLGTLTVNEWTKLAAAAFWLLFLFLAAGQWRPTLQRRLRVYTASVGGAAVVLFACLGLAWHEQRSTKTAVVITREAVVRQGPLDEASETFAVHDGAELSVLDHKDNWLLVSAGNRQFGWLKRDAVVVMGEDSTRAKKS